jgi:hypothetical protein
MKKCKKRVLFTILSLLAVHLIFGQSIPSTTTYYSKTDNGSIGKDKRTFYLSNGKMRVTDEYYGTTTINNGTLELYDTRFTNDGMIYCEDFRESFDDFYKNNNRMVSYRIYYDKKGGEILQIMEIKVYNGNIKCTYFYTNEGYTIFE